MSLPDELLLRALAFVDRRDVAAAASVSHRWNDVVNGEGSAPLWRALVEMHHPLLIAAASRPGASLPEGDCREVFLQTERLVALADVRLREGLANCAEGIIDGELFGTGDWYREARPFASPTAGTTATETPDANGAYSQPVYFDWGENWDLVKRLVPSAVVQRALKRSVDSASRETRPLGYWFDSWNETKVWPILFNLHSRLGNGEQDALMRELLPRELVQELNTRVAAWFRVRGETDISEEYDPKTMVEDWMAGTIEAREAIAGDEDIDAVVRALIDSLYEKIHYETSGTRLMSGIREASEAALYHPDGPIRETLLCTIRNSYAFMPFNYILAKLLSPEDAELRVYASDEYSVVVDERRNVVFDNFWFFVGQSAAHTLECARDRPQLPQATFDYSLGGFVLYEASWTRDARGRLTGVLR